VTRLRLDPGVSWNGWHVPTLLEVAVIAGMGALMLSIAMYTFSRSD